MWKLTTQAHNEPIEMNALYQNRWLEKKLEMQWKREEENLSWNWENARRNGRKLWRRDTQSIKYTMYVRKGSWVSDDLRENGLNVKKNMLLTCRKKSKGADCRLREIRTEIEWRRFYYWHSSETIAKIERTTIDRNSTTF